MTILNMVGGGNNINVPLNGISNLTTSSGDGQAVIKRTDVGDLVVNGVTVNEWSCTKLVRKTGSAPVSSNDGTPVLTETLENAYSVTGYTNTGLTNETTYYYGAFSVGTNGLETISNIATVTPSTQWQPGVNTLAYYHIEADDDTTIHDRAGNNDLSYSSNAYITDADAGKVANLAGQNYATGNVVNMGTEYTEIAWVYQSNNSGEQSIYTQNASSVRYPSTGLLIRGGGDIACVSMADGSANIQFPTNAWTMICWTRNSNGDMKLYLNGEYQTTVSNTDTPDYTGGEGFYLGLWRIIYYQWKGYFKTLILEDKERDASEVSSYYDQTKGDYGIS